MITHDQILPSIYHLQRLGAIGPISDLRLCSAPLRELARDADVSEAFPGQSFEPLPALDEPPERMFPDLYQEAIAALPPRNLVVVAVPDHFHYPVIRLALEHDQHVLTVKPLVLKYAQAVEIEDLAQGRGLLVGVEYHKRFDRRSLDARRLVPRGPVRPVPLRRGQVGRALLLSPFELPELVHQGEQRPVHLHRLPLRRTWCISSRACGPSRSRFAAWRERFPTARSATCGRPAR